MGMVSMANLSHCAGTCDVELKPVQSKMMSKFRLSFVGDVTHCVIAFTMWI